MSGSYLLAGATCHGWKHADLGINNQDDWIVDEFTIQHYENTYRVGLLSDGGTGIPAYSRTEVGSRLIVLFCKARIQEFLCAGNRPKDIPRALYPAMTDFLRNLANMVMPRNIYWPYPVNFEGDQSFRNGLSATERFTTDYLTATLIGFVDDGKELVTFQAGDGVIIVNGEVMIVDQNDYPKYPALSINSAGEGFSVREYKSLTVGRVVLGTDGLENLLKVPELGLPDVLFDFKPGNIRGPHIWLRKVAKGEYADRLDDDCTIVVYQRPLEEGDGDATASSQS